MNITEAEQCCDHYGTEEWERLICHRTSSKVRFRNTYTRGLQATGRLRVTGIKNPWSPDLSLGNVVDVIDSGGAAGTERERDIFP